jgi:hypothetical protein
MYWEDLALCSQLGRHHPAGLQRELLVFVRFSQASKADIVVGHRMSRDHIGRNRHGFADLETINEDDNNSEPLASAAQSPVALGRRLNPYAEMALPGMLPALSIHQNANPP